MKKMIVFTVVLSLLAAPAFAVNVTNAQITGSQVAASAPVAENISTLSNNVGIAIISTATAFSATTAHLNGSKQFGTSSETTKIYTQAFEEGDVNLIVPTDSTSTQFTGSWTAL